MSNQKYQNLTNKKILIIRSRRGDDPLETLLQDAGAELVKIPVMQITDDEETHHIRDEVLSLDAFDIVIFVSRYAALLGGHHLRHYWPVPPRGLEFFCIGETTAKILQEQGYSAQYPETRQNSEGLLALPELWDVNQKNVLIFRGFGGRELLAEELANRGATVDHCELYRRSINPENVELAQQNLEKVDCLVAHSGELLEALGPAAGTSAEMPLVVPSARIAALADRLGYRNVTTAEGALPDQMQKGVVSALGNC